jgi:hypothetical protein
VSKRQLPAQPAGSANCGSGGAVGKITAPAVWVHAVGCVVANTTLCELPPVGYEKVTVPPTATLTVVSAWLLPEPS